MFNSKQLFQVALGGLMAAAVTGNALASTAASTVDHSNAYAANGCNGGCNGSCNGNCSSQPDPKPNESQKAIHFKA